MVPQVSSDFPAELLLPSQVHVSSSCRGLENRQCVGWLGEVMMLCTHHQHWSSTRPLHMSRSVAIMTLQLNTFQSLNLYSWSINKLHWLHCSPFGTGLARHGVEEWCSFTAERLSFMTDKKSQMMAVMGVATQFAHSRNHRTSVPTNPTSLLTETSQPTTSHEHRYSRGRSPSHRH